MNVQSLVRRIRTLNMLARTAPDRQTAEIYAARVQLALGAMLRAGESLNQAA